VVRFGIRVRLGVHLGWVSVLTESMLHPISFSMIASPLCQLLVTVLGGTSQL